MHMELTRMNSVVWKNLSLPRLKVFGDVCGLVFYGFEGINGLGMKLERLSLTLARDLVLIDPLLSLIEPDSCHTLRSVKLHTGYCQDESAGAGAMEVSNTDRIVLQLSTHCPLMIVFFRALKLL